jgi:hypothetical protein
MADQSRSDISTDTRPVWHAPQLQRLNVSLDTADGNGSNGDGAAYTPNMINT